MLKCWLILKVVRCQKDWIELENWNCYGHYTIRQFTIHNVMPKMDFSHKINLFSKTNYNTKIWNLRHKI
jgi:hypothetical protein